MIATILWTLAGISGVACVIGCGWCLHRVCIRLEDAGYMYYRKSGSSGGSGGVFHEFDRLVRPSVVHVVEVEDKTSIEDERVGGD